MAKIHTLTIRNFRSIEHFEQVFGLNDFICIIGRGDSGKSTVLEAIAYALSPNWNLSFYDTDFIHCNIDIPIQITVTLYDLPKKLLTEDKYGLYQSFLDANTGILQDDALENSEPALTVQLEVNKNLEPNCLLPFKIM
ncbi:MAG: AAA family ATPase [Burkholderiales bacterium]|nr:AAA family ATPase [Burkholderiales bacterium]